MTPHPPAPRPRNRSLLFGGCLVEALLILAAHGRLHNFSEHHDEASSEQRSNDQESDGHVLVNSTIDTKIYDLLPTELFLVAENFLFVLPQA